MQYVYLNFESGIFITSCVERKGLDYLRLQKKMLLWVLLIVLSTSSVATEPFQRVSNTCIYWDLLDIHSGGDIEKLHCILDENDQLGLVKERWKWGGNGSCPYYDHSGKQIHVRPCDAALGSCPVVDIISYQAINYSACVSARWEETSLNNNNYDKQGIPSSIRHMVQGVNRISTGSLTVSCLTLLVVLIMFIQKILKALKRKRRDRSDNSDMKKLRKLLQTLTGVLKVLKGELQSYKKSPFTY